MHNDEMIYDCEDDEDDEWWWHLPFLFFSCVFETYGALMFHNWLLSHKSVFTPHIADDFIARNCAHHRPIEISTILSKSQGSATGISENIHNTLWEKSRYANFSTIWPDQVLCMLRAGWEDFYVENTLHTFQNSRPYK